jgi:uncharacterized membrane protein
MHVDQTYIQVPVRQAQRALTFGETYDLLLLAVLALLLPGLLLLPIPLLRVPLGLGLALIAPGYALAAAIFPHRRDVDGIMRIALSFGLSAALIPLLAVALDKLPWGISPWPIAIGLAVWIALCSGVALWRRWILAPLGQANLPPVINLPGWWRGMNRRTRARYVAGTLAVAAVFGAGGLSLILSATPAGATEFYILGRSGLAQDYPRTAIVGDELMVTMGIVNHDRDVRSYRVEVWVSDAWGTGRRAQVASEGPLTLAHGERLEHPLAWRMPWIGENQQVEVLLFNEGRSEPYRRLTLWLDILDQPALR